MKKKKILIIFFLILIIAPAFASAFIVIRWLVPHVSGPALDTAYIVFRKTLHVIEYAFLAWLLYRAFRGGRGPDVFALPAAAWASFTCPRICGSPTIIESRLDATRNRCRTAARPRWA